MFRGEFEYSIDVKGRTSLPAKFREVLSARSESSLVVTKGPNGCLWCFPPAIFDEFQARIEKLGEFSADARESQALFIKPAQDCDFDRMGRILVPPTLRAYAGLESGVMWAGNIRKIELWNAERYQARQTALAPRYDDEAFLARIGL